MARANKVLKSPDGVFAIEFVRSTSPGDRFDYAVRLRQSRCPRSTSLYGPWNGPSINGDISRHPSHGAYAATPISSIASIHADSCGCGWNTILQLPGGLVSGGDLCLDYMHGVSGVFWG